MALLETMRPNELLDFFIELQEIEFNETMWERYIANPFIDKSFEEYKKSALTQPTKQANQNKFTADDERKAIEKAESILKMPNFIELKE